MDGAKPRCARLEGFSLHANLAVSAHARERLEHLCRYLLRPPLALERLTESSHEQVVRAAASAGGWRDGPDSSRRFQTRLSIFGWVASSFIA